MPQLPRRGSLRSQQRRQAIKTLLLHIMWRRRDPPSPPRRRVRRRNQGSPRKVRKMLRHPNSRNLASAVSKIRERTADSGYKKLKEVSYSGKGKKTTEVPEKIKKPKQQTPPPPPPPKGPSSHSAGVGASSQPSKVGKEEASFAFTACTRSQKTPDSRYCNFPLLPFNLGCENPPH